MENIKNNPSAEQGSQLKDIDFWTSEMAGYEEQMRAMQNAYSLYSFYRQKCVEAIEKLEKEA